MRTCPSCDKASPQDRGALPYISTRLIVHTQRIYLSSLSYFASVTQVIHKRCRFRVSRNVTVFSWILPCICNFSLCLIIFHASHSAGNYKYASHIFRYS